MRAAAAPDNFAGVESGGLFAAVGHEVLELSARQANHDAVMMRMLRLLRPGGDADIVDAYVLVFEQQLIVRREPGGSPGFSEAAAEELDAGEVNGRGAGIADGRRFGRLKYARASLHTGAVGEVHVDAGMLA